jgi:hypothetical protein
LTSSKQLVCKIKEEIHHWTSNWYRSGGDATEGSAWAGGRAHLKLETFGNMNIWLQQQYVFQKIHLSNTALGATRRHIPKPRLNKKYLRKYHYQEKSDPISSKNNVVFMTAVNWMPKNKISNGVIHKA